MTPPGGLPDSQVGGYFLFSGGTFTTLFSNYNGALGSLNPAAINDSGQIVGGAAFLGPIGTSILSYSGFLESDGTYTGLSFPGAIYSGAEGINDLGQIVGSYVPAGDSPDGINYSYLATPQPDPTLTTVTTANSQIDVGQNATFTATVANNSGDGNLPMGSVQFYVDSTAYGNPVTLAGGTATISDAGLTAGSYFIGAAYIPANIDFGASSSPPVSVDVIATGAVVSPRIVAVTPEKSGNELTGFIVLYNEPLDPGSATDSGLYHVFAGTTKRVKKRKDIVFIEPLAIKKRVESSGDMVTVSLVKPYKGTVKVTVHGFVAALNGPSSFLNYLTFIT